MQKEGSFPGSGQERRSARLCLVKQEANGSCQAFPGKAGGNEVKSRGTSLQITNPEPNKTRWRPLDLLRVLMLHPSLVPPEFPYKKSKC